MEEFKQPGNTTHPLLKKFSNPQFIPEHFVSEIVSHEDTKGLEFTLEQLKESKKMINEVMGDVIYKKYDSMIKIDENMSNIQRKADNLKELLEEYQIAMQTLQLNILEDAASAQKSKILEEYSESPSKSDYSPGQRNKDFIIK